MCSPNHVIRQQRFGIDRQRDKGKESQKLAERQERRVKRGCQKQGTRAERQFLKTKSICQRLAIKANKSKN
jgi:hypothetical protein